MECKDWCFNPALLLTAHFKTSYGWLNMGGTELSKYYVVVFFKMYFT